MIELERTAAEPIPITGVARASSPLGHRQDAGATRFQDRRTERAKSIASGKAVLRCGFTPTARVVVTTLAALAVISAVGCSRFIDSNVPEPIQPYVDPELGGDYLLYQPSRYSRDSVWPLIVICHSSFPDSPNARIRAWTQLAERDGFLVAAPKLSSATGWWSAGGEKQVARMRADENRILACVRHVRAGHSVSGDRVFIHGYGSGAHAALQAGLRHSDVFRAIGLSQPKFDETLLADTAGAIDPYQPIQVHASLDDSVRGKDAQRCSAWLCSHGAACKAESSGVIDASDMQRAVGFFEDVIRRQPLIRIRALPGPSGKPLDVRFKLFATIQPVRYEWAFGDGDGSAAAEPVHTYASPGDYRIIVKVTGPDKIERRRIAMLRVPQLTLGTARPKPSEGVSEGS